jgi:hypothetical protein
VDTKPQESKSDDAPKRIAYVIPVRLEMVYVKNAILKEWLQSIHTRPISLYLLVKPTPEETKAIGFYPQVIMSRLRATYGQIGVAYSVLCERHGRMLICVSSARETIESPPNIPLSPGPGNSSSVQQSYGKERPPHPGERT